jgi:hypothetical protein
MSRSLSLVWLAGANLTMVEQITEGFNGKSILAVFQLKADHG